MASIIGEIFKEAWRAGDGTTEVEALRLDGIEDHVAALREAVGDESSLLLVHWHQLTAAEQTALEVKCAQQHFPGRVSQMKGWFGSPQGAPVKRES